MTSCHHLHQCWRTVQACFSCSVLRSSQAAGHSRPPMCVTMLLFIAICICSKGHPPLSPLVQPFAYANILCCHDFKGRFSTPFTAAPSDRRTVPSPAHGWPTLQCTGVTRRAQALGDTAAAMAHAGAHTDLAMQNWKTLQATTHATHSAQAAQLSCHKCIVCCTSAGAHAPTICHAPSLVAQGCTSLVLPGYCGPPWIYPDLCTRHALPYAPRSLPPAFTPARP